MAEVYNAQIALRQYRRPVEWAASIHLSVSKPNFLMTETIQTGGGFHMALIKNPITWEQGFIHAPTAAGLRIEFDNDLARAHPFTGTGLHLEKQQAPCDYVKKTVLSAGHRLRNSAGRENLPFLPEK